ncbi:MAG: AMP-binding protein, partial [Clostridia bacterium]|nr:AMP-binding protein [Clostridia bacterium]
MKLSFSTKGWHDHTFDEFCDIASSLGFAGVEIHNIHGPMFTSRDGVFYDYAAAATLRRLYEKKLSLPCLDTLIDPSDASRADESEAEIRHAMEIAENLHIPNIRLRTAAASAEDAPAAIENTVALLTRVLPEAEASGVTLLMETSGLFCRSDVLCGVLDRFASDSLGALWQLSAAHFGGGESPETVIKNLGAYVRHVHFCDTRRVEANGGLEFCLAGEGELPVADIMLALRSVNYDGYISLVWDPRWCEELDDMEIILSQFSGFMKQFDDPSRKRRTLYYNRAHTGEYVWEKDRLIDLTFSQVLDRMVEEFPDQYAFKYTTLDYTRTYSEFRDDVDTFARSLISMGVKAGTHVAVWASNVPQWYIAFWATVKLGAVLVTVNTAYKIHEVEYLLRQSDTHTLIMTEGAKDCRYGDIIAELCPELETLRPGAPLHARRLPFLRNVITVGYRQKGCMEWHEAVARSVQV